MFIYQKGKNMKPCDENIKNTLQLIEDMLSLTAKGDAEQEDDSCGILYVSYF